MEFNLNMSSEFEAQSETVAREKIAVIGSGLAGLTTAYLLSTRTQHEIHIFEKADKIGVDAAAVPISVYKDGKLLEVSIDVPMRSIDGGYYTHLLRLLTELRVAVRPDDLTFAFSKKKSRVPYLIYNGLSGMKGLSVPTESSKLSSVLELVYYSICYIWLCIVALLHYHLGFWPRIKEIPFERFCNEFSIGDKFVRDVVVPVYSGVCTCKEDDVLQYPAGLITDYIAAGVTSRHYVIASPQGFKRVISCLTSHIPKSQIHTSTPITKVSGNPSFYTLHSEDPSISKETTFGQFKHIILATPAPISSKILATMTTPQTKLCEALDTFKFVPSCVITHTDSSFIPTTPSLHRDLHFQRPTTSISPQFAKLQGYIETTHILHFRSPFLKGVKVYQTTNPHRSPRKDTILGETWFERYLPTKESLRVRREVFECANEEKGMGWGQGKDGVWFVGSWAADGIPLLEGCVKSAEMVTDKLISEGK